MESAMTEEGNWVNEIPLPALLRHARTAFGSAIRKALGEAGYDDVPGNGIYVIGAIARIDAPLSQIIQELRVSKQSAGQLVDALVLRGYLDRSVDPEDRRRLTVSLTERGRAAAAVSRAAVERLDAELIGRVGPDAVSQTRVTLAALIGIGRAAEEHGAEED
jgi:DNA-binding MarR family transcriptional regulator